jgi:hypothetical protein
MGPNSMKKEDEEAKKSTVEKEIYTKKEVFIGSYRRLLKRVVWWAVWKT